MVPQRKWVKQTEGFMNGTLISVWTEVLDQCTVIHTVMLVREKNTCTYCHLFKSNTVIVFWPLQGHLAVIHVLQLY